MAIPKRLPLLAVITATSLTMCGFPVHASVEPSYPVYTEQVTISRVVSVYDGDTIRVDIDHWPSIIGDNVPIRLAGLDTPERRGAECEAEKVLAYEYYGEDKQSWCPEPVTTSAAPAELPTLTELLTLVVYAEGASR